MGGVIRSAIRIAVNDGVRRAEQLLREPVREFLAEAPARLKADTLHLTRGASSSKRPTVARQPHLFVDGPKAYAAMEQVIRSARKSLYIETFQFHNDPTGRQVARLLAQKRAEGVDVKVLVDTCGSNTETNFGLYRWLRSRGVDVRLYNPKVASVGKGMPITHRKLIIADGRRFMTGDMNIGDHYSRQWHGSMTTMGGPAAQEAAVTFDTNWQRAGGAPLPVQPPRRQDPRARVLINDPEAKSFELTRGVLAELNQATRSIRVMMPYFSDQQFIDALLAARRRGVRVEVMLPRLNNQEVYVPINEHFARQVLKQGIEVRWYHGKDAAPLPQEHFSHTKFILIDDRKVIVGSANADARAFDANHELSVVLDNKQVVREAKQDLWGPDWKSAEPTSAQSLDAAGLGRKLKRKVLSWFSPWL